MKPDPGLVNFLCWNTAVEKPQDRLVLLCIGRWGNLWKEVKPSRRFMAGELGLSLATLTRCLTRLREAGLIEITNRYGSGGQASNVYVVNIQGAAELLPKDRKASMGKLFGGAQSEPLAQIEPMVGLSVSHPPAQCEPPCKEDRESKEDREKTPVFNLTKSAGEIYESYPRKIGRKTAIVKIKSAIKRLTTDEQLTPEQACDRLLHITKQYANSHAGQRGKYTPHPTTWFNREGYLDDQTEWECKFVDKGTGTPDDSGWGEEDEHHSSIPINH